MMSGNDHWKGKTHKTDQAMDATLNQEVENVIDELVGNLKNYVTVSPQEDGKQVHRLPAERRQIPSAVNAVGSLVIKHGLNGHEQQAIEGKSPLAANLEQLRSSLPKLSQDIKISSVTVNAKVDASNHIVEQDAVLTLTGKDASGTAHEVVIDAKLGLSGFDSTTPDQVDLTGKQVQTIDMKHKD
ncbi:hypothetical protein LJK88_22870 [Paenibacillus sp. P26]|nr:hypothetical protein LJK88_22870 [Paenibacillus sp. P26]